MYIKAHVLAATISAEILSQATVWKERNRASRVLT